MGDACVNVSVELDASEILGVTFLVLGIKKKNESSSISKGFIGGLQPSKGPMLIDLERVKVGPIFLFFDFRHFSSKSNSSETFLFLTI